MKRLVPRSRTIVAAAILVALMAPATSVTASVRLGATVVVEQAISYADHRCFFGTGIQVWQDAYKGGPTAIFCGTHFGTSYWGDLSTVADQLSWGANWNDRISSFEIFNTGDGGSHYIQLCTDTYGMGSCSTTYTTSVYVSYVGDTLNDRITSISDDGW